MENQFISAINNLTYTENGALTNASSGSAVVDWFFHGAALRTDVDGVRAADLFAKAFREDKDLALKILFYIRDARGGQGERNTFRNVLKYLAQTESEWLNKNLLNVAEYGRWDDLLCLLDFQQTKNSTIDVLANQLNKDLENLQSGNLTKLTLLGKWMPSENTSSKSARKYARVLVASGKFGSVKDYRKKLVSLRSALNIVENNLRAGQYDKIDYEKLPSLAALKYRQAFIRHDGQRYGEYLNKVEQGQAKINTSTLYPYDVVRKYYPNGYIGCGIPSQDQTIELAWKNLPDYVPDIAGLVVADTSGSMIGLPMLVSVSLAIYIAERNKNEAWKDYFISFSEHPKLHKIEGNSLAERAESVALGDVANTDLQAVFDLVLDRAKAKNVPEDQMPKVLLIVSDMEFDQCTVGYTNLEQVKQRYAQAGYLLPTIVFWNVDSRNTQTPAKINDQGVLLLSGCSAAPLKIALAASNSIMQVVKLLVDNDRYSRIKY